LAWPNIGYFERNPGHKFLITRIFGLAEKQPLILTSQPMVENQRKI